MTIPFSWFWPMASEVAVIVVLISWLLRRLGFAPPPTVVTGWKRVPLTVVGVLCAAAILWSVAGWISGRLVPSHDTIAWCAGYMVGSAIDDLIVKRNARPQQGRGPGNQSGSS